MVKYCLRRLAYAIPLVLAVATASFFLIHLVPGDPGRAVLGPRASSKAVAALDHQFGLDQPLATQYWHFLRSAATFNFGTSIEYRVPVASLIGPRVVPTAALISYGIILAILLAVPLAVVSARHQDRLGDHVIRLGGMVARVMPPFWLGLLLALVFGLELGLFPTSGYGEGFAAVLRSLTLPAVTLGLVLSPLILRQLRAALIEALSSDYVEAARARGLSERRVVYRHALRNSLLSTVTVVGIILVYLISSSVLVEDVFSIPGLGELLVHAVAARDFQVLQCLMLLMCVVVILVNLATDIAYAVIDPRVRL